ncbi:MAG: type I-G CRISPR-associated helicase/endonuclease Cas3g [Caulobacterales bacterium]
MSASLSPADFPTFFEAVNGYPPFPWQARLVNDLATRGHWPDLLDLPTGTGKTAAIDVAVFHLALEAERGDTRRAPMRIAFVVDRRLVVDNAFERAEKLAKKLADPGAVEIVRTVASCLRLLSGNGRPPLAAAKLRGGAPREDDWAKTPCQPTVLCSTVDQVGSRLLFRGYGVSDRMKPVHAGLLGSDALILLDEAHLSEPFRQTAKDIANLEVLHGPDPRPLQVALLTATPGADQPDAWRFGLDDADRQTPQLASRINAKKPATLVEATEKDRAGALAQQALELVGSLQKEGIAAPVVGVVANRIARARLAHEAVLASPGGNKAELIIGRSRGVDRDEVAAGLDAIKTGRPRPSVPRIIVATQTIEAGVDIDLDGLVTDAASLDALRQRFGRLNRDGRGVPSRAVVIADRADRKPKKDGDPIYGHAIAKTLEALWPTGSETVDCGTTALTALLEERGLVGAAVMPLLADKPDAPVLMPAYVDIWSHTAPVPACDPEPALFLHGPNREPAAVQVVWRADVEDLIATNANDQLRELLALVPVRAAETLELPLWAARSWLAKRTQDLDLADVAGRTPESDGEGSGRRAFRWCGTADEHSQVISASDMRAGDLIIVPSTYGGCDRYGWNPESEGSTPDAVNRAAEPYAGRRFAVRIAPGLIREALRVELNADDKTLDVRVDRIAAEVKTALQSLGARPSARDVAEALSPIVPQALRKDLSRLLHQGRGLERPAFPYGTNAEDNVRPGVVLVAARGLKLTEEAAPCAAPADSASTEDDQAGSFIGAPLSLADHSRHVEHFARAFAARAGLTAVLVDDIALSGWLHDAGKADPRFQALLSANRGFFAREEARAAIDVMVLAKSEHSRSPPGAWERAGLPRGWRHEALSVRLALENPRLQEAHDRALVLWLVGTHHGLGRPFFDFRDPVNEGDSTVLLDLPRVTGLSDVAAAHGIGPERLGFAVPEDDRFAANDRDLEDLRGLDWATLFRELRRRYGAWGLARLEATIRLADHRASEAACNGSADQEGAA